MKLESKTQSRYTPDPGEVPEGEAVFCGVCGDQMDERRGCNGPRGFAQAMCGGKSPYDDFSCPHRKEQWHQQVVALRDEAGKTASAKIATALLAEADEIASTRIATKEVYHPF